MVVKERGCGRRVKGGLYTCCGTSPYGEPIEHFLIDPPLPYNGEPFRAPIVQEKDNVKDLIFWVGKEFYPFCPDYIEETRCLGASKRVSISTDLNGLVPFKTKMYFVHPRAMVKDLKEPVDACPKDNAAHLKGDDFCIRSLYFLVDVEERDGEYVRKIGSVTYSVPRLAEGLAVGRHGLAPEYSPGFFLWLPFTHLEYVLPENGKADERVVKAREEGKPIVLVEEE